MYHTIVNASISFWGDGTYRKQTFSFASIFVGGDRGQGNFVWIFVPSSPLMGQGARQEPFVGRLRRGYLVVRLSAVTFLTQCCSETIVSMSSPSRDALILSQADRDGSIHVYNSPLAQSARGQNLS